MLKALSSRACLFGVLALALSGAAFADQPPASGLGQSWPNASDVSSSPSFHAYTFTLGGIQFVQINDLNGNVLGAVGSANGQFITLPVGLFSQLVATPQQAPAVSTTATPTSTPTTVYQDSATTVTATPLSDGTMQLRAAAACSGDPATCSTHIQ
ncbi:MULTISPECIES: hypothetical protein [Dyella]|uniref:hypothetical protein n=1 Tax=Dyella TaxID=231454 RepID=UPI000CBFE2B9|nr:MULTISPECIES: hypothetical protein [Dyella]MDR3445270.1 hypothetical protein [Dyella sp.]PMQ07183.1 hypothetical protein DyAD56_00270 [Dyella sp. AD56]ULU27209.1 hypothetical protein DYST_04163 [Dyella terrae]